MLILAIDTALDACAAAVLDTSTSQLIAQESQAAKLRLVVETAAEVW